MNQRKHNLVIIAGESSGDLHGAHLMHHMKKINPKIVFSGLGGQKMKEEGLSSLFPIKKLAVMGFWEVLKNIIFFLRVERTVLKHIKKTQPEKIILIDYPGFNLRLAKKLKSFSHAQIIYYISPQLWAWKEERVQIIKKYIDRLIVLFPFEVNWYKKHKIKAYYFGHPLIAQNLPTKAKSFSSNQQFSIALCPGSRSQEIKQHLPVLIDTALQYTKINPNSSFKVVCAPNISPKLLQPYIKKTAIKVDTNPILSSFHNVDFAIVASGTAALECAVTLTPMIVIYKMSFLSWTITKNMVRTPFASIVNILAEKQISLELLQGQFTANNLTSALTKKLNNVASLTQEQQNILQTVRPLALNQVYHKTAEHIIKN